MLVRGRVIFRGDNIPINCSIACDISAIAAFLDIYSIDIASIVPSFIIAG